MLDPQTIASAWILALSVGALVATAGAFIAAIIHLVEISKERPRRRR